MLNGSAVRELNDRQTHRHIHGHTDGTNFIPSTADAGGNKVISLFVWKILVSTFVWKILVSGHCLCPLYKSYYLIPGVKRVKQVDCQCVHDEVLPLYGLINPEKGRMDDLNYKIPPTQAAWNAFLSLFCLLSIFSSLEYIKKRFYLSKVGMIIGFIWFFGRVCAKLFVVMQPKNHRLFVKKYTVLDLLPESTIMGNCIA